MLHSTLGPKIYWKFTGAVAASANNQVGKLASYDEGRFGSITCS